MTLTGGIVVFVISWWLSFFVALPFGVGDQQADEDIAPGTDAGAPRDPMIAKKAIWATMGAIVLTALAALIVPQLLAV